MAKRLKTAHLLLVSKGTAEKLNSFRLGARLTQTSGLTIEQLIEQATRDRFKFAQELLRAAKNAAIAPQPQNRLALGKAYYAMYHACRAVVYLIEGGDDHEAHSEVPKHLPRDFPDRNVWENEIKTARYERNRADYDPYPKSDKAFAAITVSTIRKADNFVTAARGYLARKVCRL